MKRIFAYLIAGIIILLFLGMILLPLMTMPFIIHSYDGAVATLEDVDTPVEGDTLWTVEHNLASALIYPDTHDLYDTIASCGIKFSFQAAPVVYGTPEKIDEIVEVIVDKTAKTNKTKTWEVFEVELRMGVVISSYEGGLQNSPSATFWIELKQNEQSIFSNADEQYAYFVHVFTYAPAEIVGVIDVDGEHSAWTFDRTPMTTEPVPQFVLDSGYTLAAGDCANVKFPVGLQSVTPTTIGGLARAESSAILRISVMVILFGMWERTVKYVELELPPVPDFLADLIAFLSLMAWVIVGFVATIVIFRYVPGMKMKLIAVGVVWAVLLAIFGISAIAVWLAGAG